MDDSTNVPGPDDAHPGQPARPGVPAVPAVPVVRVSDDDRNAVIDLIQDAAGRGFLTIEELETRIELASAAKTRADLEPLTADLPAPGSAVVSAPAIVAATLSKTRRQGYWEVPGRLQVSVTLGKVVLDFTQAKLTTPTVDVDVTGMLASIDVFVPAGMRVDISGLATPLGKSQVTGGSSGDDGPLVRFVGTLTLGTLKARRLSATESFFRSSFDG
jgi:Domain of unknown function (DUF1707)